MPLLQTEIGKLLNNTTNTKKWVYFKKDFSISDRLGLIKLYLRQKLLQIQVLTQSLKGIELKI